MFHMNPLPRNAADKWANTAAAIDKVANYDTLSAHPIVCKIVVAARCTVGDLVKLYAELVATVERVNACTEMIAEIRRQYRDLDSLQGGCNSDKNAEMLNVEVSRLGNDKANAIQSADCQAFNLIGKIDLFVNAVNRIDHLRGIIDAHCSVMAATPVDAMSAVRGAEIICDGLRIMTGCFGDHMSTVACTTGENLWNEVYAAIGSDSPNAVIVSCRSEFNATSAFVLDSEVRRAEIPRELIPRKRVECRIVTRGRVATIFMDGWTYLDVTNEPLWVEMKPIVRKVLNAHDWLFRDVYARVTVVGYNASGAN